MKAISIPQAEDPHFLELPVVTPKEKKILEERTIAYNAFLNTLENLEEDTQHYIQKIQKKLLDTEIEGSDRDALEKILVEQKELLPRLQSKEEKKVFNFILAHHKNIFKVDPKKIKELNRLNEKNFSRLLVLVYKKIREKGLADEENLKNGKIEEVVDDRVDKAHRTEGGDWFVGLKSKIPGVGFLRKMPGLEGIFGKEEKEEKKQLSEEEVATKFLLKSLLPIITLIIVILLGGLSGPMSVFGLTIPHGIVIALAVFSFVAAEYKAVKVLFSSDKEYTSDGPDKSFSSHDKDAVDVTVQEQEQQKQEADKKQAEECGERFSKKISDIILKTPVKETEKSKQKGSKEVIVPHLAAANPKWEETENERRAANQTSRANSV